jgi:hypothetical protein
LNFKDLILKVICIPIDSKSTLRIISYNFETKEFQFVKDIEVGLAKHYLLDNDNIVSSDGRKIINITTLKETNVNIPNRYFFGGAHRINDYVIKTSPREICFINITTGDSRSIPIPILSNYVILNGKIFVQLDKWYVFNLIDYAP